MMRRWVLLLACALTTLSAFASMPAPADSSGGYNVLHYDLHLDFDLSRKSFNGSVGITAVAQGRIREVNLDAASAQLTIDSVYSDDVRMTFTHVRDNLNVEFLEEVADGAQFEVSVFYHGSSSFTGRYDAGGVYFISPDRLATISEPNFARTWWPCKDRPSDKATAHIYITVPESLTGVSNGVLNGVTRKNGKATYEWETKYPMATYLYFAAVAPYATYSETYGGRERTMPVNYYVYPEDLAHAKVDFQNTTNILRFFSTKFREYPFIREKFGIAEVDGDMTMENQTICSIQKSMITGKRTFEWTVVHETAHHWWGDYITPLNWKHTWLSEGFATYAEALYAEETKGKDSANAYIRRLMGDQQGIYAGSVTGKSDTAFWDSFSPRVYNKGALVLHMLRGITGDSLFFAMMRAYLGDSTLAYGNATTQDFVRNCEQVYGKPLQWFFDEWVYASTDSLDRPEYEYSWTAERGGDAYRVILTLDQKNAAKLLYRMPVSVAIVEGSERKVYVVENTLPSQTFTFTAKTAPTDLIIDPDDKILKIVRKAGTH